MAATEVEALLLRLEASATALEKNMARSRAIYGKDAAWLEGRTKQLNDNLKGIGAGAAGAMPKVSKGAADAARGMNSLAGQTGNIAAQFQDIAVQLQSGSSPFTIALQQGTQLGAVFSGAGGLGAAVKGVGAAFVSMISPVNLITIGLIAAGGAAVQYFMAGKDTDTLTEALKKQPEIIKEIKEAWGDAARGVEDYNEESKNVVLANVDAQARAYREGIKKAAKEAAGELEKVLVGSAATSFGPEMPDRSWLGDQVDLKGIQALKAAFDDLNQSGDILKLRDAMGILAQSDDVSDDVKELANSLLSSTKEAGDAARALQALDQAGTQLSETTRVMVSETKRFNDLLSQGLYNEAAQHAQTLGQALQSAAAAQKSLNEEQSRFAAERLADRGAGYEALNDFYARKNAGISGEAYSPSGGLLNVIAQAEGTSKGRGYNETLDYGRWTGGNRNLVLMTLDQIDALQSQMLANPENRALYGNGKGSSAVGQYQMTRQTLRGLREQLGLKGTDFFSPEMQDRLAQELIRQSGGDVEKLRGRWEGLKSVDSSVISTAFGNTSQTMPGRDQSLEQRQRTYDDLVKSAELYISEQQREAAAVGQTSEVTGLASEKARALGYEQDMLNRILALGIQVTPQQGQAISELAARMAQAETQTARLKGAQADLEQAQRDVKDSTRDAMKGFISDLIKGRDASEALSDALGKVGDTMLNIGLNYLLTGSANGQGSGGFLGWLFGSFDEGGWTGAGGKHKPAGVVHAGEYVFDQDSVKAAGGPKVLDAMRKNLRGYANGGYVSTSAPSLSGIAKARQQQTDVRVSVDDDGRLQAYVRRESGAQVRAAAPQIVSTSVKMSSARVVPTMAAYQANRAGGDYRNG
jgi:hypothetical protein